MANGALVIMQSKKSYSLQSFKGRRHWASHVAAYLEERRTVMDHALSV